MRPILARRRRAWWAVPLAAAAAGAVWLVLGREDPLARLGRVVEPPTFAGVPVRGDADSVSRLADNGMTAYAAGRFAEAARLLGSVPVPDRTPGLVFYLGVATLLSGHPADGARLLEEVSEQSAYGPEARYYAAKAWLRIGRADSALARLAMVPSDAPTAARAAALADSVRRVRR